MIIVFSRWVCVDGIVADCGGALRFYRTGGAFRFRKPARSVSIALWRIPAMRTPDMTTNRWHSHHMPCAVIGSYKPCRYSIVEVSSTIIVVKNRSWRGSLTITPILRRLMGKHTPLMSCISPIRGPGREIRIHGATSHLQRQLHEYNRPRRGERARISSHGDRPLGGHFPLIDCKKIMPQPGRRQTFVRENQSNQKLKAR
jgi:hypothetical protein